MLGRACGAAMALGLVGALLGSTPQAVGRRMAPTRGGDMLSLRALNDDDLFSSLSRRQADLAAALNTRWAAGGGQAKVAIHLDQDWVRRTAMSYPWVVAGTAQGDLVLADMTDLKAGGGARAARAHLRVEAGLGERTLMGEYDHGAISAVDCCVRADGPLVAAGGRDGRATVHAFKRDTAALELVAEFQHGALVSVVRLVDDGRRLVTGSLDGSVREWSLDGRCLRTIECGQPVLAVDRGPDGAWAIGLSNGTVAIAGPEDEAISRSWAVGDEGAAVRAVCWADGYVVTGSVSGDILAWKDGLPEELVACDGPVVALAYANGRIAAGAHDGMVRVFQVRREAVPEQVETKPFRPLLAVGGYNVWMGAVAIDEERLLADGTNDVLIIHDFSAE